MTTFWWPHQKWSLVVKTIPKSLLCLDRRIVWELLKRSHNISDHDSNVLFLHKTTHIYIVYIVTYIYIYLCVYANILTSYKMLHTLTHIHIYIYIYTDIIIYIYTPSELVVNVCVSHCAGDFLHLPQRYADGRAHPKWLEARKNRLTASRFACACAAPGARKNRKAAVLDAWSPCGIHKRPKNRSCWGLPLFGISFDDWQWPPNAWDLGSCLVVRGC